MSTWTARSTLTWPDDCQQEGRAYDAQNTAIPLAGEHKQAQLREARNAEDMWKAIGDDSWVVVPIQSAARPGHTMEGTRLTLVCPFLRSLCSVLPHFITAPPRHAVLAPGVSHSQVAAASCHMSWTMSASHVGLADPAIWVPGYGNRTIFVCMANNMS